MCGTRVEQQIRMLSLREAKWKARLAMWQTLAVAAGIILLAAKCIWP